MCPLFGGFTVIYIVIFLQPKNNLQVACSGEEITPRDGWQKGDGLLCRS